MFSVGHASLVQKMLEHPEGTIDFNGKLFGDTGYGWAKYRGHTAIVELLEKAGHTS